MKLSVVLATGLALAPGSHAVYHRHIKREVQGSQVKQVIYDQDVTYQIKKGPQTTVTEAIGTAYSQYTITSTIGQPASSSASAASASSEATTSSVPSSVEDESFSSTSASVSSSFSVADVTSDTTSSWAAPSSSSSAEAWAAPSSSSSWEAPSSSAAAWSAPSSSSSAAAWSAPSSSSATTLAAQTFSSSASTSASASAYAQTLSSSVVSSAPSSSSAAVYSSTSTSSSASASSSSGSDSSSSDDDFNSLEAFKKSILAEHNAKRALHSAGSLTWNETLYEYASNYADEYSCPSNGALTHSGGPYGENLGAGYSSGKATVDAWYDENSQYSYSSPGFNEATGHFTQVIWASTTQLGCAYKKCDSDFGYYVVCEYYPPGNVVGNTWRDR